MTLQLLQIPFSHNSIKVRVALAHKGVEYEAVDIPPLDRSQVEEVSGQRLLPVLCDGDHVVWDSTEILLYLEAAASDRPLLPAEPEARAECLILEAWADDAFMALSRRLGYFGMIERPDVLGALFFSALPEAERPGAVAHAVPFLRDRFGLTDDQYAEDVVAAARLAQIAVDRIAGRSHLVGDGPTIADIGLASMAAPLAAAPADVRDDPAVRALVAWGRPILGDAGY